jgi:hypothetical protein
MNIMGSLHKAYTPKTELKSRVGKQKLIYFHFTN